jgi:hypothetical protein
VDGVAGSTASPRARPWSDDAGLSTRQLEGEAIETQQGPWVSPVLSGPVRAENVIRVL